jgi:uncharacterized protein YheU (UPF0270 family)
MKEPQDKHFVRREVIVYEDELDLVQKDIQVKYEQQKGANVILKQYLDEI